ncbi:NIPSNAP family protein [Fimbriiglobus ruber]|uniref:NIPSNAP domain-containing protein n=1 Tax=Fimbriiglobus ruber TaxID=1908690 RepID=A0A225E8V1_9BACT|nr:NIPSNAP family protein [Fimbriiglobus ruber]OWK47188.1 hypothetical protein FRUB_00887 [Fimbriiglobus ruber]
MTRFLTAALAVIAAGTIAPAAEKEAHLFEMRVYYAAPGKLDALHARFRDHTMKLFEKHGITNVGYWVPVGENKENKLVYLLSYPSLDARKQSWAEFIADPEWKKAFAESEKDGKLVAKVEEHYLVPTDFSPKVGAALADPPHVFELRTYTASPGNLDNLNARFRDHTVKLFEKHGMTNLWYFNLNKGSKGDDVTLVYFLAHKSKDAAAKSFAEFGKDPEWTAAREASEKKGGGSLTTKGGVKSEFLTPTDYSPLK